MTDNYNCFKTDRNGVENVIGYGGCFMSLSRIDIQAKGQS